MSKTAKLLLELNDKYHFLSDNQKFLLEHPNCDTMQLELYMQEGIDLDDYIDE